MFTGCILLSFWLIFCKPVEAQSVSTGKEEAPPAANKAEDSTELEKAEREMKSRLDAFRRLQEKHKALAASVKKRQEELAQLKADGNQEESKKAAELLKTKEDELLALFNDLEKAEALYDRAVERFQQAQKKQSTKEPETTDPAHEEVKTPLTDAIERRKLATQAALDAVSADDEAASLQAELDLLTDRQVIVMGELETIDDQLAKKKLSRTNRDELEHKRNQLTAEKEEIEHQMTVLSQELILARATARIKARQAKAEAEEFSRWHRKMLRSLFILLAIVGFILLIRAIAIRRVKDPQKRYTISRNLSILAFFVVVVGLMVIFIEDLSVLFTGIGVAAAGLAIALREIVASFFGWFIIRGSKGYQVGDWVQTGELYGEVIDIGLLVTILAQVTPLAPGGDKGGSWTGAMVYFPNSTIFNENIINYTRGYPFIWAQLVFTVTYESDWKKAEKLILEAVDNQEIIETAKQAREEMDKMATHFAIRIENTQPVVRTLAADSGIELRLRFLVHPRRRRALMDRINRSVMEAVDRTEGIDFAYNTLRVIPTPVGGGEGNG
jgi:small-conductance mechanosensitive channel